MKFTFYSNACGVFTGTKGTSILCDPWIEDGVFEGSWYHFPRLKTKKALDIQTDAIYLSHIHPDHFDERNFHYNKNIPIIVLDHGPNFLIKKLLSLGYTNLITAKNSETVKFKEFNITLFAPFIKNHFHAAEIGNLIDSAIHLENEGYSAINFNDCTPTPETCGQLRIRFGKPNLALIGFNSAGPYPSCFDNLDENEKIKERDRIIERNFDYTALLIKNLEADFILPFAGEYVLGGENFLKNKYLASSNWENCANSLVERDIGNSKIILLREMSVFSLISGTSDRLYEPINFMELDTFLNEISSHSYPYQLNPMPDENNLISDVHKAAIKLKERMVKYNLSSSFAFYLNIFDKFFRVLPNFEESATPQINERYLSAQIDPRLLRLILDKKSHWNNAEIGAHINYFRLPNEWEPDLHTSLQFFHL
jgi:UDP-MurNAc hydroxylase